MRKPKYLLHGVYFQSERFFAGQFENGEKLDLFKRMVNGFIPLEHSFELFENLDGEFIGFGHDYYGMFRISQVEIGEDESSVKFVKHYLNELNPHPIVFSLTMYDDHFSGLYDGEAVGQGLTRCFLFPITTSLHEPPRPE